jgi:deferrochelatase/peroxidase EfeB
MSHSWVTIVIPMESARTAATRAELRKMDNPAKGEVRDALRQDLKIHFMSTGVIAGDPGQPSHLVMEISSDLAAPETIALVARVLAPWFGPVLAAAGIKGEIAAALSAHHVKTGQGLLDHPGLDHTGSPGMSVQRIRDEWDLARGIRDLFDTKSYAGTPLQILEQVRADVRAGDAFRDVQHLLAPEATPCLLAPPPQRPVGALIAGLVFPAIATFLWPVVIPALLLTVLATWLTWQGGAGTTLTLLVLLTALSLSVLATLGAAAAIYGGLRKRELADQPDDSLPDDAVLSEIYADENQAAQNHMTGVSRMKPGHLRRFTLRLAFWFIGNVARLQYRPGFLGQLGTIHFARWILLPGTDKLVFFSNYGGSWESYLEDFITKAHAGLTGVWSNTEGYPRASNLFGDGATDGDRFKRWARRQQQPTPFWYSAYPHVTTARIRANASIRQGLTSASTREEAELWLAQLNSRTPPSTLLETREIQTLLFGGLKHHPHAALLAISAPSDAASAKALLTAVKPLIGYGDMPDPKAVAMLALGAGALAKTGLSQAGLDSFPFAFRDGMASAARSKILSDTGDDKPAEWLWGAGDRDADAVLVIYGATPAVLKAVEAEAMTVLAAHGGRLVHRVALRDLDSAAQASGHGLKNQEHEAFGFADGVSQPLIKGARRWKAARDTIHEVEPGEFILGYPDNRGFLPLTPVVPSETDPRNLLATVAPPPAAGYAPDLSHSHANLDRDLGRNGTFLVVRQLAQDTKAFDASLKLLADAAKDHPGAPPGLTPAQLQHWIAAKMVGRWKDGTSLVRYPNRPGTGWDNEHPHIAPDNDFLLGAEDPVGLRCPFGSHIRRTNPRESFEPGSMEQLAIVNRHRILRAGRRYEGYAPAKGAKKEDGGLMFMCFNADLERQFEFVQQTWAMAPQFHGLENEVDAILGRGKTTGRLTIPTASGPLQVKGLADVVRVRGGGYFFVPSRAALDYLSS